MKTLIASLTQRWVVTPDWIIESNEKGKFIPEKKYGIRQKTNVFNDKSVCALTTLISLLIDSLLLEFISL